MFQGGGSPLFNHHATIQQQRHALDLVLAPGGSEMVGDPTQLDGSACFGATRWHPVEARWSLCATIGPINPSAAPTSR